MAEARGERPSCRPEKTDAVAKRMIAGALGVKAPKKTEEQKAYDKAIKEKEIKRRNQEKDNQTGSSAPFKIGNTSQQQAGLRTSTLHRRRRGGSGWMTTMAQ